MPAAVQFYVGDPGTHQAGLKVKTNWDFVTVDSMSHPQLIL